MKTNFQIYSWELLRRFMKRMGWDIFRSTPNFHYVPDYYGKAAAKGIDILGNQEFKSLADVPMRDKRTLLYYDRLYVIYQALMHVKRLNETGLEMAEVGTYRGGTTFFIASANETLGLNASKINCFDTFEGHSETDINNKADYHSHTPHLFGDVNYLDVKQYLEKFKSVEILKGRFQDTCHEVQNRKFSFVHLDVDLYEPTCFGLDFFDKRIARGGVMIMDDYGTRSCPGVIQAVNEFLQNHHDYFVLHPFTEQCVLVKL